MPLYVQLYNVHLIKNVHIYIHKIYLSMYVHIYKINLSIFITTKNFENEQGCQKKINEQNGSFIEKKNDRY